MNNDQCDDAFGIRLRSVAGEIADAVAVGLDTEALLAEVKQRGDRELVLDCDKGVTVIEPPPGTFWAMLEPKERELIRWAGTLRQFAGGDILNSQGTKVRHVLVVLAGRVEITVTSEDGDELLCAIRGAGDIVGELAAVDGRPRSATVRAGNDVAVLMVAEERFVLLCQEHAKLTWAVLRTVVGRMRELGRQAAEYRRTTTTERLAALLVELADQRGMPRGAEVIALPLTQTKLVEMVRESRESVVRALHNLRARQLVTTSQGTIKILNVNLLRKLVASGSDVSGPDRLGNQTEFLYLTLIS